MGCGGSTVQSDTRRKSSSDHSGHYGNSGHQDQDHDGANRERQQQEYARQQAGREEQERRMREEQEMRRQEEERWRREADAERQRQLEEADRLQQLQAQEEMERRRFEEEEKRQEELQKQAEMERKRIEEEERRQRELQEQEERERKMEEEESRRRPHPAPSGDGGQKRKQDGNYSATDAGTYVSDYDFRKNPHDLDKEFSTYPTDLPFVDKKFSLHQAITNVGNDVEWKRPSEFCKNPVLFSDGATRFDIGQGSAGTCWFLSMVAGVADRPELLHRVVAPDAWNQEHGVFTCRFWRYGEWETVHIDDFLPVIYGNVLWGAKSKDDPDELWPALLEKAFARFHGNYNAVYGGQSGDAYLALTGGCSEYIDFDKELESDSIGSMKKARALHTRIKNACKSDSILATEVPERYDKHCGLVGGHAYSLTGATTVKDQGGKQIHLVRVRNPWGHTEWKGAWRDGGPEWTTIPSNAIQHIDKDDGEFWMELKDFITYFSGVTFCSMTPDFDKDGCLDTLGLVYSAEILGEWQGPTAAGFAKRIQGPKFLFHVSDEGMDEDGCVPLVVQVCQKILHRKEDVVPIRVDLYEVIGENAGESPMVILELKGDVTNVYKTERQMSMRYKVEPGYFVAVPSTMEPFEKEFLVRVFSPMPLADIREFGQEVCVMEMSKHGSSEEAENLKQIKCEFGAFINRYNAGGQVSNNTFYTNPIVEIDIPDRGSEQLVDLCLMQQTQDNKNIPIGLRLFPNDDGYQIKDEDDPDLQRHLYQKYEQCPRTTDGNTGVFVAGASARCTYALAPGSYFVLLHTNDAGEETRFALVIRSNVRLETRPHRMCV